MLYLLLFYIIFFIIIRNEHLFHCIFIKLPQIIYYLFTVDYNYLYYQYDYIKGNSLELFLHTHRKVISPFKTKLVKNNINFMNNPSILENKNSLSLFLNMLTTPHDLLGNWKSDSIFRVNYENRGKNNKLKKLYMYALTKDKNKLYRPKIYKYLDTHFNTNLSSSNLLDFCLKSTIDLTYILHFNKLPDSIDTEYTMDFINSITNSFKEFSILTRFYYIYKLKYKYNRIKYNIQLAIDKNENCIVKYWNDIGLDKEYIYIEFIHNIIGMTINWFNLMYNYILGLSNKTIPFYNNKDDLNKYMFEVIRFTCPAKFISSSVKNKNYNIIHNLYKISRNENNYDLDPHIFNINHFNDYKNNMSKCPFSNNNKLYKTKKDSLVSCNNSILEKKNYIHFGVGYRRCPGELLSMTFLEELITIINNNKHKIKIELKKSNKTHFMFSKLETNYTFL